MWNKHLINLTLLLDHSKTRWSNNKVVQYTASAAGVLVFWFAAVTSLSDP